MGSANIFGKGTKATVGKADVKFYIGGVHQPAADFDTENVSMSRFGFFAQEGDGSLSISYGDSLPEGTHTIEVVPGIDKYVHVKVGGQHFDTTGSVTVEVSEQESRQVGNFVVYFDDGLGRKVEAIGNYEAKYTFPFKK